MAGIIYSVSWTQMCNSALGRLGAEQITDLSEGTGNAEYCMTYLGDVVEDVLGQYDWYCCRKRVRLAPDLSPPAFGRAYRFLLPADCLRIIRVGSDGQEDGPEAPYIVENGAILADTDHLDCVYVVQPEDPGRLPAPVRKAIIASLAFLLSTPLTSNDQLAVRIAAERQEALEKAKIWDARQTYDPRQAGEPLFEEARS
ncbi:MAG: hypothetical protein LBL20_01300 [Treponema sp.]|jgi:hypothetical protein|nr:hypothetical protein [Treponema sp.]